MTKITVETEQQGKCEGGKEPPSRSIKPVFPTVLKVGKTVAAGRKDSFDTLQSPQGDFFTIGSISRVLS